jgi:hypothetical protein
MIFYGLFNLETVILWFYLLSLCFLNSLVKIRFLVYNWILKKMFQLFLKHMSSGIYCFFVIYISVKRNDGMKCRRLN